MFKSRLALVFIFLGLSFPLRSFAQLPVQPPMQLSVPSAYKTGCETKLTYFSSKLRDFLTSGAIQTEQPAGMISIVGPGFSEKGNTDILHTASLQESRLGVVLHVEWYEHDQTNPELFASIQTPSGRGNGTSIWHEGGSPVQMGADGNASSRVTVEAKNLRVVPLEPVTAAYRMADGNINEWPVDYLESITLQCGIFPR